MFQGLKVVFCDWDDSSLDQLWNNVGKHASKNKQSDREIIDVT